MKRIWHSLLILGLATFLIGFVLNPGPPYQDPTREMLVKQASEEARFERFIVAGGAMIFIAIMLMVVSKLSRQWNKPRIGQQA